MSVFIYFSLVGFVVVQISHLLPGKYRKGIMTQLMSRRKGNTHENKSKQETCNDTKMVVLHES